MQLPIVIFFFSIALHGFFNWDKKIRQKSLVNLFFSGLIYLLVMIPGLIIFFLKRLSGATARSDFYSLNIDLALPYKIIDRLYLILKSNFSFSLDFYYNNFFLAILFLIICYSSFKIIKDFKNPTNIAGLFSVMLILAVIVANIPLFLILLFKGIYYLKNSQKLDQAFNYLLPIITLFILIQSLIGFKSFYNDRKMIQSDYIVEILDNYIDKYKVEMIDGYNSSPVPLVLGNSFEIPVKWRSQWYPYDLSKHNSILFISFSDSRVGIDNDNFMDFIYQIDTSFMVKDLLRLEGVSMDIFSNNYIDPTYKTDVSDPHNSLFISLAIRKRNESEI